MPVVVLFFYSYLTSSDMIYYDSGREKLIALLPGHATRRDHYSFFFHRVGMHTVHSIIHSNDTAFSDVARKTANSQVVGNTLGHKITS